MGALALKGPRLVRYEDARTALELATRVDEVKDIRDRALAVAAYARQAKDQDMIRWATEIKVRAERRAGEMLRETAEREERQTKRGVSTRNDTPLPKLKDLGVSRDQSSQWQRIATIPEAKFERHLTATAQQLGSITTGRILHAVRQEAVDAGRARGAAPLPAGRYDVLLADPPWRYENAIVGHGSAEDHYPTMSVDDICAIKAGPLAAPNATLFLWVTNPFLAAGLAVAAAWGFSYKTNVVWVKRAASGGMPRGVGFYVRGHHELLLVCTKGSHVPDSRRPQISSVLEAPVREHSRKPDAAYELIQQMYPGAARVELFARGAARAGWTAWGDEANVAV